MFFKKDKNENNDLSKVAALLIHAAKIDENFSKSEETIIKQALLQIGANNGNLESIFSNGKKIEENSNQILEFTKKVKNMEENDKIKIVETLWRIIYSNNEVFFKYIPKKTIKLQNKENFKENPFGVLKNLNLN